MKTAYRSKRLVLRSGAWGLLFVGAMALLQVPVNELIAGPLGRRGCRQGCSGDGAQCIEGNLLTEEPGATWYWMRSPEQEKTVVMGLFNKYCIRCHGVDGRGIWDIPGIPDFTNARWQASRTDGQLARIILEGRGAVMPTFRGAISLEEAWAIGRYLRTFEPGTEIPRPDLKQKSDNGKPATQPKTTPAPGK
jgi:mono/diheme cytochrome c family protein